MHSPIIIVKAYPPHATQKFVTNHLDVNLISFFTQSLVIQLSLLFFSIYFNKSNSILVSNNIFQTKYISLNPNPLYLQNFSSSLISFLSIFLLLLVRF